MAPAINPNPITHVSQSGILLSLSIFPRAKTTTNTIAAAANKHTIKNAVSIPTLYHIRDEKMFLIQARNIDATTLPGRTVAKISKTTTKSVNNTWTDYDTCTVDTSGLYFFKLSFSNGSTTTKARGEARILINGDSIFSFGRWSVTAWSGNNFAEGDSCLVTWLEAGDVVKTQGKNQNWTGNLTISINISQIY